MKKYRINYFISKGNFENNVSKFSKENNVLFITGLSGSGKTTLSNELSQQYKSIILGLDCLGNYYSPKFENTLIKNITNKFLKSNPDINSIIKKGKYMEVKLNNFNDYIKYNNMYFDYIYEYCLNHYEKNFIIEGTQLFMTIDPSFFFDKSIIIIGESSLKSLIRRLNRQLTTREKLHPLLIGRKHIKKLLNDSKRLHHKDVKKLNYFISILQKNNSCK